jgi:signal transduction histidine kinase
MALWIVLTQSLACAALCMALLWEIRQRRAGEKRHAQSEVASQDLMRLVRMTASDLRGLAVGLLGHAQVLDTAGRGFLLGAQASLLDLAEALLQQTEAPDAAHALREEAVALAPVLDFAVAQVAGQLGPGRRAWRLAPDLAGVRLLADRRALHQILLRVLTSAALATGDGDWVAVSAGAADGVWTLIVEDEGAGLAVASAGGTGKETRGLGVGLALAHALMQAHGGSLTLDSTAKVGTRARLQFPADRVA